MEKRSVINHLIQSALDEAVKIKPVELQLAWYVNDYKVIGISNSTILKPGEWLSIAAVDQINLTKGWFVRMADNEVIQALFGLGSGIASSAIKLPGL